MMIFKACRTGSKRPVRVFWSLARGNIPGTPLRRLKSPIRAVLISSDKQNMNNHALISINRNELGTIDQLDKVNEHINSALKRYGISLTVNWSTGKSFSKLVTEAIDEYDKVNKTTTEKATRTTLFKRVQGVFINEGLNDLIEAVVRRLGYQPRFSGSTKTGTVNMKFVPSDKKDSDAVGKVAVGMQKEKVQADRVKALEDYAKSQGIVDIDAEIINVTNK